MKLASCVGLNTPGVRYSKARETEFILIERFDRVQTDTSEVQRLHQEDFCQALSVPPELKYEDEGGPGISASLNLLQQYVDQPAADRLVFLRMQIFHYLVGNADAHAKNFALLHTQDKQSPSLAPAYDIVCTAAYPQLTKKIAMRIGNRNIPDTIQLKHWLTLIPDTKASQALLIKELTGMAEIIVPQAERLLKESVQQGFDHRVLGDVIGIIKTRAANILTAVS